MMFTRSLLTFLTVAVLTALSNAAAGQLQQMTNFGANPTGVQMFLYRPSSVAAKPALIVAIHYCQGTAQAYFTGTQYATLADQHGYLVIYPDAPDSGGCWDVHTTATLTHDAGGDSLAIASAVRYAIANYNVDPNRVFATGTSSGAMMTNVLAGAYPDLFKAGAAFAGGDLVRSGYPGYTGARPKMQIWQGTLDTTLNYHNLAEGVKQWTNIFGYSTTPTSTQQNSPVSNWVRSIYGPNFQAIIANGIDHNIPVQANDVLAWFGITGSGSSTTSAPTTTPTTSTPPTTTTTPSGTQAHWGQCGGIGWTGPTVCASPYTCQAANAYYSQVG
ncbi:hypothetical protein DXG01_004829 [Tephrocybe rancida]|nr:hypothetical protein DXG01_004829 [Tephrocybe rancida]